MQETLAGHLGPWIRLVETEFAEMPGLHLSKRQAQRLWNLDVQTTDLIFNVLEASCFLKRTSDGVYIRVDVASGPAA